MNVEEAYIEARTCTELVAQFNRLNGSCLRMSVAPGGINDMIDDATGRTGKSEKDFVEFFMEFIWLPVVLGAAG